MTCRVVGARVLTTLTVLNDRAGRNAALCRGYSRGMVLARLYVRWCWRAHDAVQRAAVTTRRLAIGAIQRQE